MGYSNYSSVKTADTRWWLADGLTNTNLIAVYMAIGAKTKADSLVNIINPGTGNITETGTVSWNKLVGWYGFGAGNYLDAAEYKSSTYSFVVLADYTFAQNNGRIISQEENGGTGGTLLIANVDGTNGSLRQAGDSNSFTVNKVRAIYGATQSKAFFNGESIGTVTPAGDEQIGALRIGNRSYTPDASNYFKGRVLAVAIYNTSISDAQMVAIHNNLTNINYFRDFSGMTKYAGNPILTRGAEAWRADSIGVPYIIDDFKIGDYYYAFAAVSASDWVWNNLALFRSTDLISWEPYGINPVISTVPDTWEHIFISHPSPIKIGSTYYLYYTSKDSSGVGKLGRASSPDLINWTKYDSNPIYTDPVSNVMAAWITKIGGMYYLYYYRSTAANSVMHYAISADGLTFTYGGVCFSTTTADDLEYGYFHLDPFVWRRKDGVYEMMFIGYKGTLIQKMIYAISDDAKTFHRLSKWVIEGTGNEGDWDFGNIGVPVMLAKSKNETYLYYCGAEEITAPNPSLNSGGLAIIPN